MPCFHPSILWGVPKFHYNIAQVFTLSPIACRRARPKEKSPGDAGLGERNGGHAEPPRFPTKTQRIRSSGLFPDCAAGVFFVYDGVHPLAGLLEQLFAKLRAVHLFCQSHTIPSEILKVLLPREPSSQGNSAQ